MGKVHDIFKQKIDLIKIDLVKAIDDMAIAKGLTGECDFEDRLYIFNDIITGYDITKKLVRCRFCYATVMDMDTDSILWVLSQIEKYEKPN